MQNINQNTAYPNWLLLCFFLIIAGCEPNISLKAQVPTLPDINYNAYPFLKADKNFIANDSIALNEFYKKINSLNQSNSSVVSILHIGDSHIQADYFSGYLRQQLHLRFGNAGRGLVFPIKIAKSNEPYSIRSYSSNNWKGKRLVQNDSTLLPGISGFVIQSTDSFIQLKIKVQSTSENNYTFNHVQLLYQTDTEITPEVNGVLATKQQSQNAFKQSEYNLSGLTDTLLINFNNPDKASFLFYGVTLGNDSKGILYNTVGVNGAEYRHFENSKLFLQQSTQLSADLIILSMGTNEGYPLGYSGTEFYQHIDSLVQKLKRAHPQAQFILTTPADSFRRGRKGFSKNPRIADARNQIITYCTNNNLAYWDLYGIMGGYGSMAKWYKAKLTAKDRLHFSRKGYELQGALFSEALIKSIYKHSSSKGL